MGPFEVTDPIGRGGAGEVWRGVHRLQQIPVAIKVLTSDLAEKPRLVSIFRREIHTVAALRHPAIIMVLDYGTVSEEAAAISRGRLVAGSPYLAMELAEGGSLSQVIKGRALSWPEVRDVLLTLLDALAHAHAREIIHRDIKPSNVLCVGGQNQAVGWKLTDFGVAHALDQVRGELMGAVVGTPCYMAPEQLRGRWRDFGPWTDLYAFGCLAYEVVCGRRLYRGRTIVAVLKERRSGLPALEPRCALPDAFQVWLGHLLAAEPERRFQRAVDAACALADLGSPLEDAGLARSSALPLRSGSLNTVIRTRPDESAHSWQVSVHSPSAPLTLTPATRDLRGSTGQEFPSSPSFDASLRSIPSKRRAGFLSGYQMRYRIPVEWAQEVTPHSPVLVGASLGLFGVRSLPLVGRQRERQQMWEALRDVCLQGGCRLVILRGAPGTGKSRTAQWLGRKAHEVGAASIWRTSYSSSGGAGEGLAWMMARWLGCVGLDRDDIYVRVRSQLYLHGFKESWAWEEISNLILEGSPHSRISKSSSSSSSSWSQKRRIRPPEERFALMRRVMVQASGGRTAFLWFDDAHWGHEAFLFSRFLLENPDPRREPILIVMTLQDEALVQDVAAQRMLEGLSRLDGALEFTLGPLSEAERLKLVRELLGLDGELAAEVSVRSGGNPLFAVQLVGDWVTRELLVAGKAGFVLREDAEVNIPDDLHRVWALQVERMLERMLPENKIALELAAVLGQEVHEREWQHVCAMQNVAATTALVGSLVERRLARWTREGWCFAHTMIRASVVRLAQEAGRLATYHHHCAAMLQALYPEELLEHQERLGLHLLEAGQPEASLEPLFFGARQRYLRGEYAGAHVLLTRRVEALDTLQVLPDDERRIEGWVLRAALCRLEGRFVEAERWVREAVDAAGTKTLRYLLAQGLQEFSALYIATGNVRDAYDMSLRAADLFGDLGDLEGRARAIQGLGDALLRLGELQEARECYERAKELYETLGERTGLAFVMQGLAEVAQTETDWDSALEYYTESLAMHIELGNRSGIVTCLNGLAEVDRFRGDYDAAELKYQQVVEMFDSMGSSGVYIARINLGLIKLARHDYTEARQIFEQVLQVISPDSTSLVGGLHASLLACAAAEQNWDVWDHHFSRATELLGASGVADPDDAWPVQLAADLASQAGEVERARAAYRSAAFLWRALDRHDRVAEIEISLASLTEPPPTKLAKTGAKPSSLKRAALTRPLRPVRLLPPRTKREEPEVGPEKPTEEKE